MQTLSRFIDNNSVLRIRGVSRMKSVLASLRHSSDRKTLGDSIDYINSHADDFETLLKDVFGEGGLEEDRITVLGVVDMFVPKLAMAVIKYALWGGNSKIKVMALKAAYRNRLEDMNSVVFNILLDTSENFEVRKWALHILASADSILYRRTIRSIAKNHNEDVNLRKEAIFALTNIADDESIGVLCSTLGDPSAEIRASGAWALSRISSPDSVVCLLAALEDESDDVRDWAIRALRDMDNARALQGLADSLRNSEPEKQVRLIQLLAEKKSESVLRAIAELLLSKNYEVRRMAAWAMGVSSYPPATRNLQELMKDSNEQIRNYAKIALLRLGVLDPTDFPPIL